MKKNLLKLIVFIFGGILDIFAFFGGISVCVLITWDSVAGEFWQSMLLYSPTFTILSLLVFLIKYLPLPD